jgi:outer membrane murein-binding lipoprotein Lpp
MISILLSQAHWRGLAPWDSDSRFKRRAVDKLSSAIERLRDKLDNLNAPSRDEHNQLASEVKSIQVTVAQVRVELENIRHERRENDGG